MTIAFFLEPYLDPQSHVQTHPALAKINTTTIFAGIIIARAGHTVFDLAQAKHLQQALEHHPQRNRLMALQSSLQAFFHLCKYATTSVLSTAELFKWTVLITLGSNLAAVTSYSIFLRLTRNQGKIGAIRV